MKKDVYHMIDWLKDKVDVEEIEFETFRSAFFRRCLVPMNVKNSIENMRLNIPPEEYEYRVFKLLDTERNMGYNKDLVYTHMEYTYVYFEMKTGYFESSSFRLAIEMVIERGVDDDADEDSLEYKHYAYAVKRYNVHEC